MPITLAKAIILKLRQLIQVKKSLEEEKGRAFSLQAKKEKEYIVKMPVKEKDIYETTLESYFAYLQQSVINELQFENQVAADSLKASLIRFRNSRESHPYQ